MWRIENIVIILKMTKKSYAVVNDVLHYQIASTVTAFYYVLVWTSRYQCTVSSEHPK